MTIEREAAMSGVGRGYGGLLNVPAGRHHLVVMSDFSLEETARRRMADALVGVGTTVHFLRSDVASDRMLAELEGAGIDVGNDYVSLHAFYCSHDSTREVRRLQALIPNCDRSTIELPPDRALASARAAQQLEVIAGADYAEQERLSKWFLSLAEASLPYQVAVLSSGAALTIVDSKPWFQLAGRLSRGETRGLPGGEVAYTGSAINGTFTVDGAVLATPAVGTAAAKAARIGALSARVRQEPLTFHIEAGRVSAITSAGSLAAELQALLDLEDYRTVTEVGVSFNRACRSFIHDWAAPSNEGRPGVHVAVGGDPDPETQSAPHPELVHVDFLAATTVVAVNGQVFLRTSHVD